MLISENEAMGLPADFDPNRFAGQEHESRGGIDNLLRTNIAFGVLQVERRNGPALAMLIEQLEPESILILTDRLNETLRMKVCRLQSFQFIKALV